MHYSRGTDILIYMDNTQIKSFSVKQETAPKCLHQSVYIDKAQKLYVKGANRQQIPLLVFQYIQNYIFLSLTTGLAMPL